MAPMIGPQPSLRVEIGEQWLRRPGLRVAAALLLASSGCATGLTRTSGVPADPTRPDPPTAKSPARPDTILTSSCSAPVVVQDANTGALLARIEPPEQALTQIAPPKTLQSSYEDYLARRGPRATRSASNETEHTAMESSPVTPVPPPRVAYGIPAEHWHIQVEEGFSYGFVGPVPVGPSRHAEVFAIVAGVGLLLAILDTVTRKAPVVLEVTAGTHYVLHCDRRRTPWVWVTRDDDASSAIPVDPDRPPVADQSRDEPLANSPAPASPGKS